MIDVPIGSGKGGPWALLNFKALHRNLICAIEKIPSAPQLLVPSSSSDSTAY